MTDRHHRSECVDAGGLQPLACEGRHVAPRRSAQAVEEVVERCVPPLVAAEVILHSAHERVVAHPGDQLPQHRRTLVVRDPVEVHAYGVGVRHVVRNGVRRDQLILACGDRFHRVREVHPHIGEASGAGHGEVGHVGGECLIEPQVAPPAHGGDIAETVHVCHLVQDRLGASRKLGLTGAAPEDVGLVEGDAPRVFHGAHVELGNKELVVLVEWIRETEVALEEFEAGARDLEDIAGLLLHPLHQRLAAPEGHGDASMRALHHVVCAADERDEVWREWRRGVEAGDGESVRRLGADHACVAADAPRRRRGDAHAHRGLHVGLIEARQHLVRIERFELGVDVHATVNRIGEPVQSHSVNLVLALRFHVEAVLPAGQPAQPEARAVEAVCSRTDETPVQRHLVNRPRRDVDERFGALVGTIEGDLCRAGKRRRGGVVAQRERDRVREIREQLGPCSRLSGGEIVV